MANPPGVSPPGGPRSVVAAFAKDATKRVPPGMFHPAARPGGRASPRAGFPGCPFHSRPFSVPPRSKVSDLSHFHGDPPEESPTRPLDRFPCAGGCRPLWSAVTWHRSVCRDSRSPDDFGADGSPPHGYGAAGQARRENDYPYSSGGNAKGSRHFTCKGAGRDKPAAVAVRRRRVTALTARTSPRTPKRASPAHERPFTGNHAAHRTIPGVDSPPRGFGKISQWRPMLRASSTKFEDRR